MTDGTRMPGRNGGNLRRGNTDRTQSRADSRLARDILEAKTPQMARLLVKLATTGRRYDGKTVNDADWIRGLTAALDRGKVVSAKPEELPAGDGLTVNVVGAGHAPPPPGASSPTEKAGEHPPQVAPPRRSRRTARGGQGQGITEGQDSRGTDAGAHS